MVSLTTDGPTDILIIVQNVVFSVVKTTLNKTNKDHYHITSRLGVP